MHLVQFIHMKLRADCVPCLIERAKFECDLVFREESAKIAALRAFAKFLADNLSDERTPSFYGTERERMIKRMSGVDDPYLELKKKAEEVAKSLMRYVEKFYASSSDKTEALLRIAAVANAMEYGVRGYEFNNEAFASDFMRMLNEKLHWDKNTIYDALERYDAVLYLTDNAGEVVFDAFVVRELINRGKLVVISPKSEPVLNDATVDDLKEALEFIGIPSSHYASSIEQGRAFILPSGAYVGVSLEEASPEFIRLLRDERFLIIAKGMGNYEGLSEFESTLSGRLLYILKAKCTPVAQSIGVNVGELVAKLVVPHRLPAPCP